MLKNKFRFTEKDFTRKKKLTFTITLLIISNLIRKSLSLELVNFISYFNKSNSKKLSNFTQSAFIQSRNKIKPEVFKHLSSVLVSEFYTDNDLSIKLWNGFRLLAVDGSMINLPDTKELEGFYGRTQNQTDLGVVQARTSVLYDVLNSIVIDGKFVPKNIGEISLAKEHLSYTKKGDLLIYDRGYPSFELIFLHNKFDIDYLFRVKEGFNNVVKAFVQRGKTSQIVKMQPSQHKSFKDKDYTKESTVKVRLIKVILDNGTCEILMTSLLNSKKYKTKMFKELYFKRWKIETFYDELKNKLNVENFSGYSNNTIQQDFNVAIFISNLQTLIVNDLEEEIKEETKDRKLKYKVNTNLSYGFLKNRIITLLEENGDMETELKKLFKKHLVPIRPNRKYKRDTGKYRCRTKPKIFKNQKDTI